MESLSLKAVAAVVSALAVILGSAFLIDERYAHAEQLTKTQRAIENKVDRVVLEQRKWLIEDRLQSIEVKAEPQRTDYERAQAARYQRELESVDRQIRALAR